MCKAIDVAMQMINTSIDMAKQRNNADYYMDCVKLQKLMYLGQCYMLECYGRPLFEEDISAHFCGPCIEEVYLIAAERGFGLIQEKFAEDKYVTPSLIRVGAIEWTLETFGACSTGKLVYITKSSEAYKKVEEQITDDYKPNIPPESMDGSLQSLLVEQGIY